MRAVNLIPSEARGDAGLGGGRSGGGAYAVLGLLAGLTLLALLYGIARHQVSSRQSEVAAINARAQRATENDGQLSKYTSFLALHNERLQAVTQLANSRFAWAHSLYELGRVLPLGVSITSLSGSVGTAGEHASNPGAKGSSAVASATPPGSVPTFTLTGCATGQSTVAVMLNRLSLIHGVAEATLQASSSSPSAGGGGAGAGGGGASSHSCPTHAPTFTVLVTYKPLPSAPAASSPSSSSSLTSDATNSTLQKAESTGGAG